MVLKTNYKEDVLAASNTKRKYNMITNDDGTVSFEDVTEYQQIGDNFGAGDINSTNTMINNMNTGITILGKGYVDFEFKSGDSLKGKYQEIKKKITIPGGTNFLFLSLAFVNVRSIADAVTMLNGPYYSFEDSDKDQEVELEMNGTTDGSGWRVRVNWLAIREIIL